MKFLPLHDFDLITSALNFTTSDCRVTGGCDLYTTKAAGSDKKLYKTIDRSLEQQHASLLKFGASLSPPQREEMAASLNLSRSSPFGPLSEISSRRTFAYLIATLNASHPDYDFSHVLRPTDFRRERVLKKVMSNIDYTLNNVRPQAASSSLSTHSSSFRNYATSPSGATNSAASSPVWGPEMWTLVDKEMKLKDCNVFSYQPADDPFDGEEAAIWSLHYFFFNKTLKRVAYLYVRGVPAVSLGTSPALLASAHSHHHHRLGGRTKTRRGSNMSTSSHSHNRRAGSVLSLRGPAGIKKETSSTSANGASKRARFWLGEKFADKIVASSDAEDDVEGLGDQIMWDPDEDVEIDPLHDGEGFAFDLSSDGESSSSFLQESSDEEDDDEDDLVTSPVRGMSEDIAARMEIE